MKTYKWMLIIVVMAASASAALLWWNDRADEEFECRARINLLIPENACEKTANVDVFLAINKDDKGYLLMTGSWSCPVTNQRTINGVVNFTYQKTGSYYSLHLGERAQGMTDVFTLLEHDDIKVKLTRIDAGNYALSTPFKTIMVCTRG